jgi:hypothetical protein
MELDNLIEKIKEQPFITYKKIVGEIKDEATLKKIITDLSKIYDDCCMAVALRPVNPDCIHIKARKALAEEEGK